jgi:hypothetical protein
MPVRFSLSDSVADRPQTVAAACPPRAARDLAPWPAAERIEGRLCCRPGLTHPFPPLFSSLVGRAEKPSRHCRHPLRRARKRSPPHHHRPNCVSRSALKPATSPSTPRSQSRFGRVTFSFSSAAVPRRSSSARRLSVARGLWASLSPTCRCVRVEVEWGCSSGVRVGMSGSPAARFRHHRAGGPPCPTASTLPWLCRPVLATNRCSSMTWSCSYVQFRRPAHRRRASATTAPPSASLSLTGGATWSVARARGREP